MAPHYENTAFTAELHSTETILTLFILRAKWSSKQAIKRREQSKDTRQSVNKQAEDQHVHAHMHNILNKGFSKGPWCLTETTNFSFTQFIWKQKNTHQLRVRRDAKLKLSDFAENN